MIKLKDLLAVMSYAAIDFSDDAFVQILDESTQAHYRLVNGKLMVGGDFLPGYETDPDKLLEHQVSSIEMNTVLDQFEIYVK